MFGGSMFGQDYPAGYPVYGAVPPVFLHYLAPPERVQGVPVEKRHARVSMEDRHGKVPVEARRMSMEREDRRGHVPVERRRNKVKG